jgi:hypothetical protein
MSTIDSPLRNIDSLLEVMKFWNRSIDSLLASKVEVEVLIHFWVEL